jgi:alkylhydroperoxidase/carboxymuconolactone decarboxylase family protein YurZ
MTSTTKRIDYSQRDQAGVCTFYVPLKIRPGISLQLFDDYWRDVHGPVCARLPGQHQYWQFHVARNEGGVWPESFPEIKYTIEEEYQFDGIPELTFRSEADLQRWFNAAAILMSDEHNVFSKTVGYTTKPGNSRTFVDYIPTGDPNGNLNVVKLHVMVKKAHNISVDEFRSYMWNTFAPAMIKSEHVLKFRLHLLEEHDNSETLPPAPGVSHYEAPEDQFQAVFEIAFEDHLAMEMFFTSDVYAAAIKDQPRYVRQICCFPERDAYTFVYEDKMTLSGQRGSTIAQHITDIGAVNQVQSEILDLMIYWKQNGASPASPSTSAHASNGHASNGSATSAYRNAVLDDKDLQAGLNSINPKFGDLCTRVAGEVWGQPLIDQKTKALITIAIDVVNQGQNGPGSPFGAHVDMAMKQGATREEIEELLLFMCAYAGFNKAAGCFGKLNEILGPAAPAQPAATPNGGGATGYGELFASRGAEAADDGQSTGYGDLFAAKKR